MNMCFEKQHIYIYTYIYVSRRNESIGYQNCAPQNGGPTKTSQHYDA